MMVSNSPDCAPPNLGRCVDGDTPLPDPVTGEWRTIRQVYDAHAERAPVLTLGKGKIKAVTPIEYRDAGVKKCFEVRTRSGFKLVVPTEDPLLTPDGWLPIGKLVVGCQVAVAAYVPAPEYPEPMSEWEIDLLAGMIADGGTTSSMATFSKSDPEIVERMRSAVNGAKCVLKKYAGRAACDWHIKSVEPKRGRYQKTGVRQVLEKYGLWGVRSTAKSIPTAVFRLPNAQLARFLGMLWSCDGSVQKKGILTFGVSSWRLIEQVRQLLLRFGVSVVMRAKKARCNGKLFDAWEMTVKGESMDRFLSQIPLVGVKAKRAKKVKAMKRHPVLDYLKATPGLRQRIRNVFDSSGKTWAEFWVWYGWESNKDGHKSSGVRGLISHTTNTIPRVRLRKFCEFFKVTGWDDLVSEEVWWDEIVSISSVAKRHVYDLTVDETHNLVAGGMVA